MFNSKYAAKELVYPLSGKKHIAIPRLMVAFDTETTGIPETPGVTMRFPPHPDPEPVSYGLVIYKNGREHHSEHFITEPSTSGGYDDIAASRIHGLSAGTLTDSHGGKIVRDQKGNIHTPALHPQVAIDRVLSALSRYQQQGAYFVGHNLKFDYDMLERAHSKFYGRRRPDPSTPSLPMIASGFDLGSAKTRTIDTLAHAKAMDDYAPGTDRVTGEPYKSHSLEALTRKHGIDPGGHTSVDDARASARLFFKQVEINRGGR